MIKNRIVKMAISIVGIVCLALGLVGVSTGKAAFLLPASSKPQPASLAAAPSPAENSTIEMMEVGLEEETETGPEEGAVKGEDSSNTVPEGNTTETSEGDFLSVVSTTTMTTTAPVTPSQAVTVTPTTPAPTATPAPAVTPTPAPSSSSSVASSNPEGENNDSNIEDMDEGRITVSVLDREFRVLMSALKTQNNDLKSANDKITAVQNLITKDQKAGIATPNLSNALVIFQGQVARSQASFNEALRAMLEQDGFTLKGKGLNSSLDTITSLPRTTDDFLTVQTDLASSQATLRAAMRELERVLGSHVS